MHEPQPGQDHVLVTGLGKTGTSGVYTSIKVGLADAGHAARTIFEPQEPEPLFDHFRQAPATPLLTKIILQELQKMDLPAAAFDRRVITVRDPRDTAISGLLFRPLITAVARRTDEKSVQRFVDALRRKERDPTSMSVVDLYRLTADLDMGSRPGSLMVSILQHQLKVIEDDGFHVVRYEDFVRGDLDGLSDYLGFPVRNISTSTSNVYGHTSRSEGSGSFRDWFLPSDLEFFNQRWGAFLERAGYPLDVELTAAPVIDPATSSEYVRTRFAARRAQLSGSARHANLAQLVDRDFAADYAELVERSLDGDPVACVRAAQLAVGGKLGTSRPDEALRWARLAAEMGSTAGMQLAAGLLRPATAPSAVRERLGWEQEYRARVTPREDELTTELETVQTSTSFRLGNALVRAAQSPRRNGPGAVREVARLWRARATR